jgi:hypothetical protein
MQLVRTSPTANSCSVTNQSSGAASHYNAALVILRARDVARVRAFQRMNSAHVENDGIAKRGCAAEIILRIA